MSYNDDERIDPTQDVTGYKSPSELLGEISGKDRLGVDLVTVLDVSGSMKDGDKLQKMKIALKLLSKKLSSTDRLSVVTFADGSERLCPLRQITENSQQEIEELVNDLVADGNANIGDGLETGLKVLNERRFTNKRSVGIVLLSDGHQDKQFPDIDFNDVPLYTVGFGPDHDVVLMAIAHNSDGGTFSDVQNKFFQYLVGPLNVVVQVLKVIFTQVKSRIENVSAGLNKVPKTKEVTTRAKQNPCPTHSKFTLGLILFIFCLVVSFISYKPVLWYSSSQLIQPTQYSPLMKTEELLHETAQPIEEATQKDDEHQLDGDCGDGDVLMNTYIEEANLFSEDDDPIYDDESTISNHIETSKEPGREEVKTRAKQNPHPTHSKFNLGWILFSFCLFVSFIFNKPIPWFFSSHLAQQSQSPPLVKIKEMRNKIAQLIKKATQKNDQHQLEQRSVIQRFFSRVHAFFTELMNIYLPEPAPVPKPEQASAPQPQPEPKPEPQPEQAPEPEPDLEPQPEPELEPAPVPELEPQPQPAPEPPVVVVKKPKLDENVKQQLTAYIEKVIQSFKSIESTLNITPGPGTDDHGQVMSLDENVKQTLAAYIQKAIQSLKTIENTLIKSG